MTGMTATMTEADHKKILRMEIILAVTQVAVAVVVEEAVAGGGVQETRETLVLNFPLSQTYQHHQVLGLLHNSRLVTFKKFSEF
jgi:hypothetical protein